MSYIAPRAKIALGFMFLTFSMSVTFFSRPADAPSNRISLTSFSEIHRVEMVRDSGATEESGRLLREVTALQEDLARMDRIEPAVSSPAP